MWYNKISNKISNKILGETDNAYIKVLGGGSASSSYVYITDDGGVIKGGLSVDLDYEGKIVGVVTAEYCRDHYVIVYTGGGYGARLSIDVEKLRESVWKERVDTRGDKLIGVCGGKKEDEEECVCVTDGEKCLVFRSVELKVREQNGVVYKVSKIRNGGIKLACTYEVGQGASIYYAKGYAKRVDILCSAKGKKGRNINQKGLGDRGEIVDMVGYTGEKREGYLNTGELVVVDESLGITHSKVGVSVVTGVMKERLRSGEVTLKWVL